MASKPVSTMTKSEAAEYLTELGDKVNPSWTSVEIKSRISELLKQRSSKVKLTVNANAKKEVIKEACEDNNVHLTGHETKGDMMRKLREKIEIDSEVTAHTLMTIGRHSGKSFREIWEQCPTYATWARTTVKENKDAHWKLQQFAQWVDRSELEEAILAQDEKTDGPPEEAARTSSGTSSRARAARAQVTTVPMDVDPGARKASRRGPTMEEDRESAAGSSTPQDKMMEMMQKMAEKIEKLELRNKELEDKVGKTEKKSSGEEVAPKTPGSKESEGSWAQVP